mgnify:FL=1
MKIGSYIYKGKTSYGVEIQGGIFDLGSRIGDKYPNLQILIRSFALAEANKLSSGKSPDFSQEDIIFLPLMPDNINIYCAGINYLDHIQETGRTRPEKPTLFLKTYQSMVGHLENLVCPSASEQYDFEGELAVIIGKPGKNIARDNWEDYVAGYTILMDGSVRDFQKVSVDQGKNFYHSSSVGPWLVTRDECASDFSELKLTTRLNSEVMQSSDAGKLCFDVPELISYYSKIVHFQPGDIIATGTPGGVGSRRTPPIWMKNGDQIEVEISGLGTLSNTIIDE